MPGRTIGAAAAATRRNRGLAALLVVLAVAMPAAEARAAPAETPPDSVLGAPARRVVSDADDTFVGIARRYGLGYVELRAANPGVHPWLPKAGTEVLLPTQHVLPNAPQRGIVINLADLRLYWFPKDGPTRSFPIAVGREGWRTPDGSTRIAAKRKDPVWYPPASIREEKPFLPRMVPAGPNNPLGAHALNLGWPAYVIHGTNKPAGVGRRVSHGCVRMYPESIEWLFSKVSLGTPVTVVRQPLKLGWLDGELYIEVHPANDAEIDEVEAKGTVAEPVAIDFWPRLRAVAGDQLDRIDAERVRTALRERRGLPVRITEPRKLVDAAEPSNVVDAAAPSPVVAVTESGVVVISGAARP